MASAIIAALRTQPHLRGNTFLIATELAHRMNPQGYGRVSYQYLAWKVHCCRQTAITQIARLIGDYHLFRKQRFRTAHGNAVNLYIYVGPRLSRAFPPAMPRSQTLPSTLPPPKAEEAKELSLAQQIRLQRKGLQFLMEGSDRYQACLEKIQMLEARAG